MSSERAVILWFKDLTNGRIVELEAVLKGFWTCEDGNGYQVFSGELPLSDFFPHQTTALSDAILSTPARKLAGFGLDSDLACYGFLKG